MRSGPPASATVTADQLLERFLSASPRQQRSLLAQLEARRTELRPLLIDRLAGLDASGRFGFSVQGRLLQACGGRWERLWPKLGWKEEGLWTRYPKAFTWSLEAPDGHMPLINQLRGVRLMDALHSHPALQQRVKGVAEGNGTRR